MRRVASEFCCQAGSNCPSSSCLLTSRMVFAVTASYLIFATGVACEINSAEGLHRLRLIDHALTHRPLNVPVGRFYAWLRRWYVPLIQILTDAYVYSMVKLDDGYGDEKCPVFV